MDKINTMCKPVVASSFGFFCAAEFANFLKMSWLSDLISSMVGHHFSNSDHFDIPFRTLQIQLVRSKLVRNQQKPRTLHNAGAGQSINDVQELWQQHN
jgi:hypothetical protein